ncbi:putative glycosyltransferase 6 domain-containing protein 1 isoform X1 [Fukomys damarensis]|uniref:putative glycosyltransferase 6 domain-containing protein 1 isoform X1 n=1 Tax=Fukomys damarensis TaxID=885580 RepID=UPI00053FBDE9|nr:putative glycosyltransferase 6 domain-containing protein 1 isoform X1 [Fukomys damarensis]XP_010607192.1 putative glycosyltransferase 6 domain-containing protein 1 isoform X1 [Fukomys damarensis]
MNSKKRMLLLISFILTLLMAQHYFRSGQERELQLSEWFKPRRRPDILTVTSWLAPVLWEGTFSRQALQRHYRGRNLTVGLVVFAPTRSADGHLERFLRSAITHFMPGQRVVFYLILDSFVDPPDMQPSPLQSFQILMVGERWWWPDLDLMGLQVLREHLLGHITDEVDFLFSTASNLVFQGDFGLETLGTSVAQLHAWWYFQNNQSFPYERRPSSAAYIPFGQGDFYYGSAIVGGLPRQVLALVQECLQGMRQDLESRLNSTYEKHLNKYFFLHRPSKLLSPEYGWDAKFNLPPQVLYVKVAQDPRVV